MEEAGKRAEGARRKYTVEFKKRVVEATFAPSASVARVALAHKLNTNLVFKWRLRYQRGEFWAITGGPSLVPVKVVDETPAVRAADERLAGHIELRVGRAQLRIQGCVDAQTLQTVVRSLVQ